MKRRGRTAHPDQEWVDPRTGVRHRVVTDVETRTYNFLPPIGQISTVTARHWCGFVEDLLRETEGEDRARALMRGGAWAFVRKRWTGPRGGTR